MGLFDISIQKEIESKKQDVLYVLKEKISNDSISPSSLENDSLLLDNFKPNGVFLKFNIKAHIQKANNKKNTLIIDGELQQVLLLTILILISILFTYGIGVILVVAFTYLQKQKATKYLNLLIDKNLN